MSKRVSFKVDLAGKLLFYLPLVFGALFMLVMIVHYGVNTPFWDSWDIVSLFQKVDHHTLGFADLWHQHNEHRIFFPLLVLTANAYVTHWNTGIEMIISLFFATVTVTLLFIMLRKSFHQYWIGLVAGILVTAWFFSPVQWQNWLWGSQVAWFMSNLGVIAMIFVLLRFSHSTVKNHRRFLLLLAIVAAFFSTFSLASGIFAWVVGFLLLVVLKQSKKTIGTWSLAGVISAALYYYHLTQTPTPSGPALEVFLHQPVGFIKFFLALMGGPVGSFSGGGLDMALSGGLQLPLIIGGLLLAPLVPLAYCVWQRRDSISTYAPWLALVVYAVLCCLSTAYGRLGYGIDLVFKSRYTSFTLLYVIGVSVLTLVLIDESQKLKVISKKLAVLSLLLITLPLLLSSYIVGVSNFQKQSMTLQQIKSCTSAPNPPDTCLITTYPRPWFVAPRLEYAKAKHLAGY